MADAWCEATCARLDVLHALFAADARPPMELAKEAEQTVLALDAPQAVHDPAHRHELLRKLSRLAAVLSDRPHILQLVHSPQPDASGPVQAAAMVCIALQAYCAAVQGCVWLADAIWEPDSAALQQLLAPMAALLAGPCLHELEAASRTLGAGPEAAGACATAANMQESLSQMSGLVLTRCGSEAMAAAVVTPNPRRLAHFLGAVNNLLLAGWEQVKLEHAKRIIVQAACRLPYALLLPLACRELQQQVAADVPLQRTIVQLVLSVALPHAAVAVAQAGAGMSGNSGSGSSSGSSVGGSGMPSVWPPPQRQPLEGKLWFDVGAILHLLACPCLGEGRRQVLLQPRSGSDSSPALLQAVKLVAGTLRHLPATQPAGVDDFIWRQMHAGVLSALGTLCSLLPITAAQTRPPPPPPPPQQQPVAVGAPGSRHHQAMVAVAAAVPALAASLQQVAADREAEAPATADRPLGAAALKLPLSQLCGALECCLASLQGMAGAKLSTHGLQHLLAAGTAALRLLPLLLQQQPEPGAGDVPAEGTAAAAKRLAQCCLQTALLAGEGLTTAVALEVDSGMDQAAEQNPFEHEVVLMIRLMHQAALPYQPQVHALHAAVCRLLAWQRSPDGPADRGWAGEAWYDMWSLLEALRMHSFAKPNPRYPGAISHDEGMVAAHNCALLAAVLDSPGAELLRRCLDHLRPALTQGNDKLFGTAVVHALEAALSRLCQGDAPLPAWLAVGFLKLIEPSALVTASLACSGWLPRLAQATLQAAERDASTAGGSTSSAHTGDNPSELPAAILKLLLRKLVDADQECEEAHGHAAVLREQLTRAASAPPAEMPAQLFQLLHLPALRSLAHAVVAEHNAPASQEKAQLELAKVAASRKSCGYLMCPNLGASEKGKLCKGCHTVRYCSQACAALDWRESAPGCPGHRRVCKLLAAKREAADEGGM